MPREDVDILNDKSTNGEFLVSIARSEAITAAALNLVAAWSKSKQVSKKTVNDYLKAVGPAYQELTGHKPTGVPVPVCTVITAENDGGFQKTAFFHCYLVDVPVAGLLKFLSD